MHDTRFINEIFAVLKQKLSEDVASRQVVDKVIGVVSKSELEAAIKPHI